MTSSAPPTVCFGKAKTFVSSTAGLSFSPSAGDRRRDIHDGHHQGRRIAQIARFQGFHRSTVVGAGTIFLKCRHNWNITATKLLIVLMSVGLARERPCQL
jgi:hypothetical protein